MLDIGDHLAVALAVRPGQTTGELRRAFTEAGMVVSADQVSATLQNDGRFCLDATVRPVWNLVGRPAAPPDPVDRAALRPDTIPPLYAWQSEALEAWTAARHCGVIEAVTGTGKTMIGIAASADAVATGARTMVLVPSLELLRQWTEQVRKHVPAARIGHLGGGKRTTWSQANVIIAVVNSARYADLGPPGARALLVADECHRYGSESNALALDDRFDRRLGLSATYARSDDGNNRFLDPYFGDTCFRMDYRRAIDDEVTARFSVALIATRFTPQERVAYDEANRAAWKAQTWLIDRGLVPSEPFGEFMREVSALAEGGAGQATIMARLFLSNFSERRRVLAETKAKRDYLAHLVPALRDADRSIVFTQTIDAADSAARMVSSAGLAAGAIHSGLTEPERRAALERFSDGRLNAICAPQVLDEGIDVPAADLAVIAAASRSKRQMIQRMGRVLRRKTDGRIARFAVLYVSGSSEDPYTGAHGDFLEEITDVAEQVEDFALDADPAVVCDYLSTKTPPWKRPTTTARRPAQLDEGRGGTSDHPTSRGIPTLPQGSPVGEPTTTMSKRRRKRLLQAGGCDDVQGDERRALIDVLNRLHDLDDTKIIAALRALVPAARLESVARSTTPGTERAHCDLRVIAEYRQRHPKWVDRFLPELEALLASYPAAPERFLLEAVRHTHDPREIEHRLRVQLTRRRPPATPAPRDGAVISRTLRGPAPAPKSRAVTRSKRRRAQKQKPDGPAATNSPVASRKVPRPVSGSARFCPGCGHREEACTC